MFIAALHNRVSNIPKNNFNKQMLMSDVRARIKKKEETLLYDGRYEQGRMRYEQKFLATNLKFFDREKMGKK